MEPRDLLQQNSLLQDRTRLAIIAALARESEPIAFGQLQEKLQLTGGNLSVHTRKLEEAGLIAVEKKFLDRKPITTFAITATGRADLASYLQMIESILRGTAATNLSH